MNHAYQQFDKLHGIEVREQPHDFLQGLCLALAEHNAIACLLNCYIREYAQPAGEVNFDTEAGDCPLVLQRETRTSSLLQIHFPQSEARLLIRADRISLLGRCRFSSSPYLKYRGLGWRLVDARELCRFLLQHLALTLGSDFNDELLEQVADSIVATQAFLRRRQDRLPFDDAFLRSEQNLVWGHAMHPAPKSRRGIGMDDMLACSPEIFASFPLYWFRVAPQLVDVLGSSDCSVVELFSVLHGKNELLYPCHPWEVQTIMRQPAVRAAIASDLITPLGFAGQRVAPTSSVRTLYHPDLAVQMKFSIHVRLTNCVRKNAWYELESAVILTRLLKPLQAAIRKKFPRFDLMLEPIATTLDLDDNECREAFGILYRENIPRDQRMKFTPMLAASLFAWDNDGESVLVKQLSRLSLCHGGYEPAAECWLKQYLDCLVPAVFHYFFHHGVVFEPHLQNVLVGFTDDMPSRIWVRDLEGTKLLPEHWPADKLDVLSQRARESVCYSREQGWNRIAYCLLINNISEAIFHAAAGNQALERRLWQQTADTIAHWQKHHGIQPELQAVLKGQTIPCKNNLTARLLKQADRAAGYTALPNPMVAV